jgi:endonuclease/exonuclease/phosphatase family metal-dependent hydrolase
VVRRVLPGRRHQDDRPASTTTGRWAGPPPLLLVATVVALVVTPFVDRDPQPPEQVTTASATAGPLLGPPAIPKMQQPARLAGGTASGTVKPVALKPVRAGVATFNMYRKLSVAQARQDALALTRRPSVDVVGWQEAQSFGAAIRGLPGWTTQTFGFGAGRSELAVSWRSDEFRLVRARQRVVATGVGWDVGRYPFGTRLVAVVTLQDRTTGRTLTVVNTHLPQAIEDLDRAGRWTTTINAYRAKNQLQKLARVFRTAPGRWVVGTGDYNFDARADARNRPAGGPRDAFEGVAVSSYQKLGVDVTPTFPPHGRWIDYVWADRQGYAEGRLRFAGQRVLAGLNSDHHALVAQLVLS